MLLSVGVNLTGKPRSQGFSWGQSVAASRRAVAEPRCGGEVRRVLGVEFFLRRGGAGVREPFWDGLGGGSRALTDGVPRGLGGGCVGGARIHGKQRS